MLKQFINLKNAIVFFVSFVLFFLLTWFCNTVLTAYDVTSIRISAALNPILGIAFGWPAIIGCALANFASDFASNFGLKVALLGIIPQIIYGALPYFAWRKYIGCESHLTRLDSPKKTIFFTILMAINSVLIGLGVGYIQYAVTKSQFWSAAYFAGFCDFTMCMIFGLPLISGIDYFYSKFMHKKKRSLTINEIILLVSGCIQIFSTIVIAAIILISGIGSTFESVWAEIFSIAGYSSFIIMTLSVIPMFILSHHKKETASLRIFEKENGTIFVDEERRLEFISYPGVPLENRVKADYLGISYENAKKKVTPSYEKTWFAILSNQKGCPMKCSFCDCPGYGYYGNVTLEDFHYQVDTILDNTGTNYTKSFEIDFCRMGEPTYNKELLKYIEFDLCDQVRSKIKADDIIPSISTMMPRTVVDLSSYLLEFCRIKNEVFNGNASLQISLNTTDEALRRKTYRNMSLSLMEIAETLKNLPTPKGQKYALSFAVTRDSVIDAEFINNYFDKEKFFILLTPIHETFNATDNGFKITSEYSGFEVFEKYESKFLALGWDVSTTLDKQEDDIESLTSGNLLLSNISEKFVPKITNKKRVGLVVAIEIDAIFKKYPNWKELDSPDGFKVFIVEKEKYDMYICQSGMGISKSSAGVQYLISKYNVSLIINYGVVGGLTGEMGKQKVCIVDKIVHYKYDCSEFMDLDIGQVDGHDSIYLRTSPNLLKNAKTVNNSIPVVTCCSGDKFIGTTEEKTSIHERFNGDICDMEAAGIALTCEANKVPLVMFKAVADGLSDGAEGFFAELENASIACLDVADKIMEKIVTME